MGFKYPGCADCYFHDREPAICDDCEDESNYEPAEEELAAKPGGGRPLSIKPMRMHKRTKVAA